MGRPEVRLDNYGSVYDYYSSYDGSPAVLRAVHKACAMAYHPNSMYEDGAEQRVGELLAEDTRLLIASNHINLMDQFPIAAEVQTNPKLRPIVGNTFIPGKAPYFRNPLTRRVMDIWGVIPTFRDQEVGDNQEAQAKSTSAFLGICAKKVIEGKHMFIFPEGTRNKKDPTKPGRMYPGIGKIACAASDKVLVAILTIGVWHGKESVSSWRRPELVFARPLEGPFEDFAEVTARVGESLNSCVGKAIENSIKRAS